MANKKDLTNVTEVVEENVPEKVIVNLALSEKTENGVLVGLNGKNYLIKPGVDVEVPAGVAKILKRKEKAIRIAWENKQKMKMIKLPE